MPIFFYMGYSSQTFIQTLTTLHLGWNKIGDKGAQHLGDALKNNTVILILLSFISYTHLKLFIQTLTTLNLEDNNIQVEVKKEIDELIKRNRKYIK